MDQEKQQRALSMAWGVVIAATAFVLVLSFVAWFMPKFFVFADSRWAKLLPAISLLFIILAVNRRRRGMLKRRA